MTHFVNFCMRFEQSIKVHMTLAIVNLNTTFIHCLSNLFKEIVFQEFSLIRFIFQFINIDIRILSSDNKVRKSAINPYPL